MSDIESYTEATQSQWRNFILQLLWAQETQ